jgi:hypothetical protein
MQDTHRGIVHSFVDHFKITNTNHVYTGRLFRRIASFYHMAFVENGADGLEGSILVIFPVP